MSGRAVMITGGGNGIGRALVRGFLQSGARVINFTRSEPSPPGLSDSDGERCLIVIGDVTSRHDVQRAVTESIQRFGRIDVLINNAGIQMDAAFVEADFEAWARVIDVNLKGTALCTREVLPVMIRASYGRIVNIVSRAAEDPVAGKSAYSASKAAAITLTKALAKELAEMKDCDILVNGLIPGSTRNQAHPTIGQEPELVFPFCLQLATLPRGGPSGRFFRHGRDYSMYSKFNADNDTKKSYSGHLPSWLRR
jgi:NAD(P)-dependent dehydrogenase (short-subunit alcohol dehydrogenase family)